ncbi:MAG: ester cyclase, partial [Granulosicoccus sp.]|nr:ester cyclase [Granulosicoccus sp.]
MDNRVKNKAVIDRLRSALYDFDKSQVRKTLQAVFSPDAAIQLSFPFGDLSGPEALYSRVFEGLHTALPDLERRDFIRLAGTTKEGYEWVGCAGYYTGIFVNPWLDIPPTGHQISLRFHEFYRLQDGIVVEMQAVWDIPDVMRQAGAWPLAPGLGREWHVPGPATNDGVIDSEFSAEQGAKSCDQILAMLTAMS